MAKDARIYMVDDDPQDIFLTKVALRRAPFSFDFTGLPNGQALFDHIRTKGIGSIDLLLLDMNMPVMGGVDILQRLSTYPDFRDLKIVMFSTSGREQDKSLCIELGAEAYILKPANREATATFLDRITTLIGKPRAAPAL